MKKFIYNLSIPIFMMAWFVFFVSSADSIYSQNIPGYSFIGFNKKLNELKKSSENSGYKVSEKDINSPYGKKILLIEKNMNFYSEKVYLYFNENEELIYFSIFYNLNENQPRKILEELFNSIKKRLIEKYDESENSGFPYFKKVEERYIVFLHPFYAYSNSVVVSFKDEEKYKQYEEYYDKEIKKLETDTIQKTISNF